jgi:hypothetical protein
MAQWRPLQLDAEKASCEEGHLAEDQAAQDPLLLVEVPSLVNPPVPRHQRHPPPLAVRLYHVRKVAAARARVVVRVRARESVCWCVPVWYCCPRSRREFVLVCVQ